MLNASPDSLPLARTPNQPWCDLGTEVVVLRVKDNAYYRFDGSGRAIWLLLEQPQTPQQLTAELAKQFSGDTAMIRRDVESFLARCSDLGLVGAAGPAA